MFMKGVEDDCPGNCLSVFSFGKILFTACCKSTIGKRTQYSLVERVFLKTSSICGS